MDLIFFGFLEVSFPYFPLYSQPLFFFFPFVFFFFILVLYFYPYYFILILFLLLSSPLFFFVFLCSSFICQFFSSFFFSHLSSYLLYHPGTTPRAGKRSPNIHQLPPASTYIYQHTSPPARSISLKQGQFFAYKTHRHAG